MRGQKLRVPRKTEAGEGVFPSKRNYCMEKNHMIKVVEKP